jgi:hypothetical protein
MIAEMKCANARRSFDMATKQTNEANIVDLKQLRLERLELFIMGESALISHAWSHKAKKQMLNKQMKKATAGKAAKNPQADFEESIYRDATGLPAFPSVAFKSAAVDAAQAMDFKKTNLRQSFHIDGDFVPILGDDPAPREDMVRVGMGTADIRYRAEFRNWGTVLPVTINTAMLSVEQLVNLLNAAGFGIGVGEWRPQRDGQYGRFRVAFDEEQKVIEKWRKQRRASLKVVA